jgi:hypothetical protein
VLVCQSPTVDNSVEGSLLVDFANVKDASARLLLMFVPLSSTIVT